ncbi:DET1 homolog isoform X2 [Scylla paramamosain]
MVSDRCTECDLGLLDFFMCYSGKLRDLYILILENFVSPDGDAGGKKRAQDAGVHNNTDEAVMGDEPGIPVHQIPPQNLVVRLFHREIHKSSHYQAHANRTFYQNITPNFTVTNVQKPPCFLRKFSPDGRFLIAFSNDQTSIEIFQYMGPSAAADILHWCESGTVLKENGPKTHEIRRNIFDRFFRLKHTVSVATNGEQLNRECSLFTDDGKYVIVGSASVDVVNSIDHFDMYRNNESVTPNPRSPLEDYTLHIVDIEMGRLTDSRTFMHDKIFLSHNQGLYLYRHTLAVLSVQHQTIHIFQITPDGYFLDVRTIGRVCYEDDDYLLATVCTDRMQRSYHHTREKIINSLKHRLLVFLYKRAEAISKEEGNPRALREFFHYFDPLLRLRMWKMQLLDDVHLLIKYASEEVVTLRAAEPNGQPSFFVVYNMITTEVLAVYENTSSELLDLFEKMADFFRNARLSCESQFTCSPSNNTWARLIHKRFKKTFINARGGGVTEATKRLLGQLPISAQSFSASPYLDLTHFSYDDKWVSVMERPKSCADHPIRFYGRDSGLIKFSINAGRAVLPGSTAPSPSTRRLVAFTFHPADPFTISVQRANTDYVVNFHLRHQPS